ARHPSRPNRVSAARISSAKAGPGLFARATARRRVGTGGGDRRAHRRRACRAPAQGAVPGARTRPDPHRARHGLRLRRDLWQAVAAQAWLSLNTECRGGRSDDPKTLQACEKREKVSARLKRKGCLYQEVGDWWKCPHWRTAHLAT